MLSKRDTLNTMLKTSSVLIHVNGNHPGTVIDKAFPRRLEGALEGAVHLRLDQVSHRQPPPLSLEDDGIYARLSKNGSWYDCVIPWEALVVAMEEDPTSEEGKALTVVAWPYSPQKQEEPKKPFGLRRIK